MKTLTIAAACLVGGVALGATSGVVAGELITGKDIKDGSITGQDLKKNTVQGTHIKQATLTARNIKKGSITTDRIQGFGYGGVPPTGTAAFSAPSSTLTDVTDAWKEGPTLHTIPAGQAGSAQLSAYWHGELAASGGTCQLQLRIGGAPVGTIVGAESGVKSPRDAASGLATGRRQHLPVKISLWYRGTADACVIGSEANPSNGFFTYQKIPFDY